MQTDAVGPSLPDMLFAKEDPHLYGAVLVEKPLAVGPTLARKKLLARRKRERQNRKAGRGKR